MRNALRISRADLRRGGGGEASTRGNFQAAADFRELEVVRAEVVSPLGDAVRFVDGRELDRQAFQPLAEGFVGKALGSDVEQLERAGIESLVNVADLLGIERRIQPRGGNALRGEGVHLVPHQRDERGNDEREAVEQQRGKLIAQRLSAAGGKNSECGAPFQQGADYRFLSLAEGIMAEAGAGEWESRERLSFPGDGRKREALEFRRHPSARLIARWCGETGGAASSPHRLVASRAGSEVPRSVSSSGAGSQDHAIARADFRSSITVSGGTLSRQRSLRARSNSSCSEIWSEN